MSFTGLDLLFLEVNSLLESVEFYVERLGFELESMSPEAEPPMATIRAGDLKVMFAQQHLAMARRGRGVHFFIGVEDVDAYFQTLVAAGLNVAPPDDEGWGGRFITIEDADHYRLFFVTWHAGRSSR